LLSLDSWFGSTERLTGWRGYAFAAAALVVAMLVRVILGFLFEELGPTFILFLFPVIAAALVAGTGPGLAACAGGWFAAVFVFVEPTFEFKTGREDLAVATIFITEGTLISLLIGRLRKSVARVVDSERRLALGEARLRIAQDAADIATFEWTPTTGRTVWSENAARVMGLAPGPFGGTFEEALDAVFPDDVPGVRAAADVLMRTGHNQLEMRVIGADGGTRWIEATGTMVPGPAGSPDRVVGVMMDITERRKTAETLKFLAAASAELGISLEYRRAVASVARIAVPLFADMSAVVVVEDGRFPGQVVDAVHRDEAKREILYRLETLLAQSPDRPGMLGASIRSGSPLFVPMFDEGTLAATAMSPEHLEILRELRPQSIICIPLRARERALGALIFATEQGRSFNQSDFDTARELGRRAALAVENALLLDQSIEREAEATRANEALQLLADAGMDLNRSLNLPDTLTALTNLVVPRFADICIIDLLEEGELRRVATSVADERFEAVLQAAIARRDHSNSDLWDAAAQVIRSDRPIFLRELPSELLARLETDEETATRLAELRPRSLIIMPLTVRSQTVGVMSFIRTAEASLFDRSDLSLAGQIARRASAAADNARLYSEARRANDAKDEFLGMMSHELRTPITVIHGGARVIQTRWKTLDDDTRAGLMADIERESERLSRMLENLLALARAELDREVVLEPVLLQRLMPALVENMESSFKRELKLSIAPGLPTVHAEGTYIEHIVRNLVGNAVKYGPADSPIEIEISPHLGGAAVRVRDRGFGIAAEEANKIFERFYRSDRTSNLAGGAGLGLAVCKRLVEAMSGEIWANPREGGGLEVGFCLPPYRDEEEAL